MIKKGDNVKIVGSAEEKNIKGVYLKFYQIHTRYAEVRW